jgi:large subunit ribosomal protein L6
MSRIGKSPIIVSKDVTVTITGATVVVKGIKGELSFTVPAGIVVKQENGKLVIENKGTGKPYRALHGCVRAIIANNIAGVTKEWEKTLELSGVGYRAAVEGKTLVLTIGFSHPVRIDPPEGIVFAVKEGKVVVSGIDRQLVGQVAANIREVRKPEPYKGKGIKYSGEHIRKKAGKAAKAVGGTA